MRAQTAIGFGQILIGLLVLGNLARGQEKPSPKPEATYSTPRAVFDAMNKALDKNDYKTVLKCITPDSHYRMVWNLTSDGVGLHILSGLDAKRDALAEEFDKTLAKHGVTKEAMAKLWSAKSREEREKAAKFLAAQVKDKAAFLSAVATILEKQGRDERIPKRGKLKDLTVAGNKAKGKIVTLFTGGEMSQAVDFVKIGGSWQMVEPDLGVAKISTLPIEKK